MDGAKVAEFWGRGFCLLEGVLDSPELDGVREGGVGEARDALGYEERAHRRTHLAGTAGWEGRDGPPGAWG